MNVIDGKGDLRMAFYESSRKSILYLGEEKQRSHPTEKKQAGAAVGLWCQNPRYRWVIKSVKFINIQTSKTCKTRGILAKLDAFMKDPVPIVLSDSMKSKKKKHTI